MPERRCRGGVGSQRSAANALGAAEAELFEKKQGVA